MKAATMVNGARRRVGLSQRELARRTGVPQASVSRIERGLVSPSADMLERLLRECGLEIEAVPRPGEGVDRTMIVDRLRLSPKERILAAEQEWRGAQALVRAVRKVR
jgi:transcriptional regulator with XRE-family HTH domain